MSEPIIIKTPQPDTEERLVLVNEGVPLDKPFTYRDATPEDLARGGWVPREGDGSFAAVCDVIQRAHRVMRTEPGSDLVRECARVWREGCEAVARAEKAEARVAELALERDTLRAELARLTAPGGGEPTDAEFRSMWTDTAGQTYAERARIIWRAGERAGVAHERARHGPCALDPDMPDADVDDELRAAGVDPDALGARGLAFVRECQGRATDEELWRIFADAREAEHGLVSRAVINAVADRVRQEPGLVERLVEVPGVRSVTFYRTTSFSGMWGVAVNDRTVFGPVAPAEVPATLARLAGLEVGK